MFRADGPGGVNISLDVPDQSTGNLGAYGTYYWVDLLRADGSVISTHGSGRGDYYTDGVARFSAGVTGDYFIQVRGPDSGGYDPGAYGLTVDFDASAAFTYETDLTAV